MPTRTPAPRLGRAELNTLLCLVAVEPRHIHQTGAHPAQTHITPHTHRSGGVKDLTIANRPLLHAGVALPPCVGKFLEPLGGILDMGTRQMGRQHPRIFNRHASTLRQVRQHRMRCITKEHQSALRMLMRPLHRWPTAQGPQTPVTAGSHQIRQRCTSATQDMV